MAAASSLAAQAKQFQIRDLRTMTFQGPSRTYLLVKIAADDELCGIAEAYGPPAYGVKEQIVALKPGLEGKDPLEIDRIYTLLDEGARDLSGTRTDGSAHNFLRAASAIEIALWNLAGKALGVPASKLLGGRFRQKVRVYDHAAPADMLDKASCRAWADR
jgi:L-alanine-DL-glutamate epimerase-like enolase superfamily enzyme